MRTPSNRMFPHTAVVERRPLAVDPADGNTPLGAYAWVATLPCSVVPVDDVKERQVLGIIEAPVTYRVRMSACGSLVQLADRLTISGSGAKILVAHLRNSHEMMDLYVMDCYDEP